MRDRKLVPGKVLWSVALAGAFLVLCAFAQFISGVVMGDWMHVSALLPRRNETSLAAIRWLQAQDDAPPADDAGVVDDDKGLIPRGGEKQTIEVGLWTVCSWVKASSYSSNSPEKAPVCGSIESVAAGDFQVDDDLAATPRASLDNVNATRALSILAAALSGVALLLSVPVALYAEDSYPKRGLLGRLSLATGALCVLSMVLAAGSMGAWADSNTARDLQEAAVSAPSVVTFSWGSSFIMVGLGIGLQALALLARVLAASCYDPDRPRSHRSDYEDDFEDTAPRAGAAQPTARISGRLAGRVPPASSGSVLNPLADAPGVSGGGLELPRGAGRAYDSTA